MLRRLCRAFLLILCSTAYGQTELDQAYFGLEFKDGRDAVHISWIDPGNRTLKNLKPNDVVLSAGDVVFRDAAELTVALKQRPSDVRIRFEVLALTDKKPRRVLVKPETLREAVPRRFEKGRDRDARQVLYAPKLKATSFFIAVAEDFDGNLQGLRLRFYPKSSSIAETGAIKFHWRTSGDRSTVLPWSKQNYVYDGLTETELEKLPTLSNSQFSQVRRNVFLEFGVDQTETIAELLEKMRRQSFSVSGVDYKSRVSSENEQRNFESALLFHRILKEAEAKVVAPVKSVKPFNDRAAERLDHWSVYEAPTAGFVEQVYLLELKGDNKHTTVMLQNKAGDKAATISWSLEELPYLTVWKNTGALNDGYVTGGEPGTNSPNNRSVERAAGRVPKLALGASHRMPLKFGLKASIQEVKDAIKSIESIGYAGEAIDTQTLPEGLK